MVLDYSSFTCVGLCRDVVCIVFGNQTEQSGVGAGRRRGRKKRRDEYEDEYEAEVRTRSKREREAQAYAKDQRPKRKKRRWKIILEDIDSWEKYSFTFCDSVGSAEERTEACMRDIFRSLLTEGSPSFIV